jgi:hypothetical protein
VASARWRSARSRRATAVSLSNSETPHVQHLEASAIGLPSVADCHRRPRQGDVVGGARSIGHDRRSTYRFVRHYAEMVVVMFIGVFALMGPTARVFRAFGMSWPRLSPAMNVFAMALTMTVPMVGWMRYRGHTWRANVEMAASMLIATFAVMGALWPGIAKGGLMVPEHVGILSCMLVAMLLRRDEYSCATHHNHARPAIAA